MTYIPTANSTSAREEAAKVVPLRIRSRLVCSQCGAAGEGSCHCGAPYMPAGQRAAEAVAAGTNKSARAIAEEIGVDEATVRRAKKSGAAFAAPDEARVTGKDGKSYPAQRKTASAQQADPSSDNNKSGHHVAAMSEPTQEQLDSSKKRPDRQIELDAKMILKELDRRDWQKLQDPKGFAKELIKRARRMDRVLNPKHAHLQHR